MDPHYLDFGEVDSSALHLITRKEVWNNSEAKYIYVFVNVLCLSRSLVGGREQLCSLLLKTDHINT